MAPIIKNQQDLARYYDVFKRLFNDAPKVHQRVANNIAGAGQSGSPLGTASAFLRATNNAYANAVSSYGQYNRGARYADYQEMESMEILASGLDIYADEICTEDEHGQILTITSPNMDIRNTLTTLFYDVLNIEFHAWGWARSMCKYGDLFLLIDHHPDYGVMDCFPLPVNELQREEGYNPQKPMDYRFRWTTQGNRILEPWQIAHFRIDTNDNFLPYGMSALEPARRPWRQTILMEDAVMTYRMVRSPERRVFYIDVGNIAPQDVPAFMEKAKTQLKKSQIVDNQGRIDHRFGAMTTLEDYFIPTRGGKENSSQIDTLPGGQFTGDIEDLIYFQNKLFAALKIPKSYLGYEQDVGSKSQLSQEDVRFARTIKRLQRIFVQELKKIAMVHLATAGYSKEEWLNFNLTMSNPSMIAEMQRLELWRTKFEVASIAQEGLLDRHFVHSKIFNLSNEEMESVEEGKRRDRLYDLGLESIQVAGAAAPAAASGGGESQPSADASQRPNSGLPPPPGEAGGDSTAGIDTASKDPNIQAGAPNELINGRPIRKTENEADMPNLKNYVFNMKKTSMDPQRTASELSRFASAPFGEGRDEEALFVRRAAELRNFAEEIEKNSILMSSNQKNSKKVITG